MNLTTNGIIASSGGSVAASTTYSTILARASSLGYTAPSAGVQTKQSTMMDSLKTAGLWDKLDLFYVMAGDGDSNFACLNWVAPSLYQASKINSPTYTSLLGFSGNGSSAYLDTNWNVTLATKASQNNIFHGVYTNSISPGADTGYHGGGSSTAYNMINSYITGGQEGFYANAAGAINISVGNYSLRAVNRNNSTQITTYQDLYRNFSPFSSASAAPTSNPIYIMARGVPAPQWQAPSNVYFKIDFWGSTFSTAEVTTFKDILDTYINSL